MRNPTVHSSNSLCGFFSFFYFPNGKLFFYFYTNYYCNHKLIQYSDSYIDIDRLIYCKVFLSEMQLIPEEQDVGRSFLVTRAWMQHFYIGYAIPEDILSLTAIREFLRTTTDLSELIGFYGAAKGDLAFLEVFQPMLKEVIYGDLDYENNPPPMDYWQEPVIEKGVKTMHVDHNRELPAGLEYDILYLQAAIANEEQAKRYLNRLAKQDHVITNAQELSGWGEVMESGLLVPKLIHHKKHRQYGRGIENGDYGFEVTGEQTITGREELERYLSEPISASDMILLQKVA
jgi:hypothetical protein